MIHSQFSPSQLSRIIECPGSVALYEALGSPEKAANEAAEHGTMLHDIMHEIYLKNLTSLKSFDISVDDKAAIKECVSYYKTVKASIGHNIIAETSETMVSLKSWGIPEVFGTNDRSLTDNIRRHLHVFDWKFGYTPVYPDFNSQLLAYAAGIMKYPYIMQKVTLHICQPAIDNFSSWTINADEIYRWVHSTLATALHDAQTVNPTYNPGKNQCQWCPCIRHCDAHLMWVDQNAGDIFKLNGNLPEYATHERIIELLDKAYIVEAAIKAYYKALYDDLCMGATIPGKKLVRGRSNRAWKDEETAVKWLDANTDIEDLFVSKAISPSQAEKFDKSLKSNKDFQDLFEKPPGKLQMVDESDVRPAETVESNASEVFKKFAGPAKLE